MSLLDIAALQQNLANNPSLRSFDGVPVGKAVSGLADASLRGSESRASAPFNPPWQIMPDGGFPFSYGTAINTPAIAVGTWVDVINFTCPNGSDGVINTIANNYNGQGYNNGSGQLLWRIIQNGQAIRNYDNIVVQLGPNGTNVTQIRISSGDLIQFQVQNVSLVTSGSQIYNFMGGWFYPTKLGGR